MLSIVNSCANESRGDDVAWSGRELAGNGTNAGTVGFRRVSNLDAGPAPSTTSGGLYSSPPAAGVESCPTLEEIDGGAKDRGTEAERTGEGALSPEYDRRTDEDLSLDMGLDCRSDERSSLSTRLNSSTSETGENAAGDAP